ncbi:MAG: hypothetical protein JW940_26235 [Polyangiaceae bacterium]|nr:hypothetical protein [Polyangiaceae bacterium]
MERSQARDAATVLAYAADAAFCAESAPLHVRRLRCARAGELDQARFLDGEIYAMAGGCPRHTVLRDAYFMGWHAYWIVWFA